MFIIISFFLSSPLCRPSLFLSPFLSPSHYLSPSLLSIPLSPLSLCLSLSVLPFLFSPIFLLSVSPLSLSQYLSPSLSCVWYMHRVRAAQRDRHAHILVVSNHGWVWAQIQRKHLRWPRLSPGLTQSIVLSGSFGRGFFTHQPIQRQLLLTSK